MASNSMVSKLNTNIPLTLEDTNEIVLMDPKYSVDSIRCYISGYLVVMSNGDH